VDEAVMIVERSGFRQARKVRKLDGGKLLLQSFDREFRGETVELKSVSILGRCVKLTRSL
jgi:SOS-response transcriptional repressor LexA